MQVFYKDAVMMVLCAGRNFVKPEEHAFELAVDKTSHFLQMLPKFTIAIQHCFLHSYIYKDNKYIYMFIKKR